MRAISEFGNENVIKRHMPPYCERKFSKIVLSTHTRGFMYKFEVFYSDTILKVEHIPWMLMHEFKSTGFQA